MDVSAAQAGDPRRGRGRRVPEGAEWTRFPVARLRYTRAPSSGRRTGATGDPRCHHHDRTLATWVVTDLLTAVDADRSGIFG